MKTLTLLTIATCLISATPLAMAQKDRFGLAGSGSIYFPSSGLIRERFGNQITGFGIRPEDESLPIVGRILPDFNVLSASRRSNRFFILSATASLGKTFGREGDFTRPYVRVGAGLAYFDYRIRVDGERESAKRLGWTANFEAGLLIAKRLRLSAGYHLYQRAGSFRFDGFEVRASYTLFRF
jgi:hypothetical protein